MEINPWQIYMCVHFVFTAMQTKSSQVKAPTIVTGNYGNKKKDNRVDSQSFGFFLLFSKIMIN